jgi:hypothetical protein
VLQCRVNFLAFLIISDDLRSISQSMLVLEFAKLIAFVLTHASLEQISSDQCFVHLPPLGCCGSRPDGGTAGGS